MTPTRAVPNSPALSRSELQAKLHKRIAELKRGGGPDVSDPVSPPSPSIEEGGSPGSTSRDALLEERRLKRGQMRDRRRNERKAERRKAAEVQAKKAEKAQQQKGKGKGNLVKGGVRTNGVSEAPTQSAPPMEVDGDDGGDVEVDEPAEVGPTAGPSLAFSSLAFSSLDGTEGDGPGPKRKRPSKLSKDPALAKVALERREAYLAKLNPEQRERAVDAAAWDKATLQASGAKVMDDGKKLAKAVKRQEKERRKKREAWREREEGERKGKEDRQKKRTDNIEKRKQLMAAKRLGKKAPKDRSGKGKKPGHRRPVKGF